METPYHDSEAVSRRFHWGLKNDVVSLAVADGYLFRGERYGRIVKQLIDDRGDPLSDTILVRKGENPVRGHAHQLINRRKCISCMSIVDGILWVAYMSGVIELIDIHSEDHKLLLRASEHRKKVQFMSVMRTLQLGTLVVTASLDGTIILWESTGRKIRRCNQRSGRNRSLHTWMNTLTCNNSKIFTGSDANPHIEVYGVGGRKKTQFYAHAKGVKSIVYGFGGGIGIGDGDGNGDDDDESRQQQQAEGGSRVLCCPPGYLWSTDGKRIKVWDVARKKFSTPSRARSSLGIGPSGASTRRRVGGGGGGGGTNRGSMMSPGSRRILRLGSKSNTGFAQCVVQLSSEAAGAHRGQEILRLRDDEARSYVFSFSKGYMGVWSKKDASLLQIVTLQPADAEDLRCDREFVSDLPPEFVVTGLSSVRARRHVRRKSVDSPGWNADLEASIDDSGTRSAIVVEAGMGSSMVTGGASGVSAGGSKKKRRRRKSIAQGHSRSTTLSSLLAVGRRKGRRASKKAKPNARPSFFVRDIACDDHSLWVSFSNRQIDVFRIHGQQSTITRPNQQLFMCLTPRSMAKYERKNHFAVEDIPFSLDEQIQMVSPILSRDKDADSSFQSGLAVERALIDQIEQAEGGGDISQTPTRIPTVVTPHADNSIRRRLTDELRERKRALKSCREWNEDVRKALWRFFDARLPDDRRIPYPLPHEDSIPPKYPFCPLFGSPAVSPAAVLKKRPFRAPFNSPIKCRVSPMNIQLLGHALADTPNRRPLKRKSFVKSFDFSQKENSDLNSSTLSSRVFQLGQSPKSSFCDDLLEVSIERETLFEEGIVSSGQNFLNEVRALADSGGKIHEGVLSYANASAVERRIVAKVEKINFQKKRSEEIAAAEAQRYDEERVYKFVCVGDGGVGKTELIQNWRTEGDPQRIDISYGSTLHQHTKIVGQAVDCIGFHDSGSVPVSFYRGAMGALVVFDASEPDTLSSVASWIREIRRNAEEGCVIIVAANKADLLSEAVEFDPSEAGRLCREMGVDFHFPVVSASAGEVFRDLLVKMHRRFGNFATEVSQRDFFLVSPSDIVDLSQPKLKSHSTGWKSCCGL